MTKSNSGARSIYLIKRVETIIKNKLEEALRDFGITPAQYTTMSLLKTNIECSSAALARRTVISAQSMSEMIATLERKELIARHEKPSNRRVLQIGLTPSGQEILSHCEKQVDMLEQALFKSFAPDDIVSLRRLLKLIIADAKDNDE